MTLLPHHSAVRSRSAKWTLQRWAVTSGGIGFLLTITAVTAVVVLNGGGWGSVGAGILVAGFDGFPFGAMVGVMMYYLKYPEVP